MKALNNIYPFNLESHNFILWEYINKYKKNKRIEEIKKGERQRVCLYGFEHSFLFNYWRGLPESVGTQSVKAPWWWDSSWDISYDPPQTPRLVSSLATRESQEHRTTTNPSNSLFLFKQHKSLSSLFMQIKENCTSRLAP